MNGPAIEADGLRKTFGQVTALDGLSGRGAKTATQGAKTA
jgi:hypothetical protein